MKPNEAGDPASSAAVPTSAGAPKTISPAARKFAEYLARRMRPMIDHARQERGTFNDNPTEH
jgi:hypothetical protein